MDLNQGGEILGQALVVDESCVWAVWETDGWIGARGCSGLLQELCQSGTYVIVDNRGHIRDKRSLDVVQS